MAHRDYLVNGSEVHIDIYDDRMEIYSPGGTPDGSMIQDRDPLTVASTRRNPVLVDVFNRLGYMERKGSGFGKIISGYEFQINYNESEARQRGFLPKKDEIKWLFFDVGSTLVDESRVYEDRMKRIADLSGLTYEQINKYAMSFYKENKKGDLEVARQLGVKLPKWESQYERLNIDTKDCLKKLSRIYKIGVIANQSLGTSERLENLGVRKYLDLIIASAEEGVSKPDRRIFEIALERSRCRPENAVMIGDRIDNDIVPAKQLGMKTIWVKQGFGSLWNITDESEKADIEINNLSDILKYL